MEPDPRSIGRTTASPTIPTGRLPHNRQLKQVYAYASSPSASSSPLPRPSSIWTSRPALPGTQDQERPQQGPEVRPRGCQASPPRHHECPQPHRRAPFRRPLAGCLSEGCRMPARRPPRPLPIPHARRTEAGADHERHRTALPGGPAADPAHGNLPGPHLHGTRPLRHPLIPEQKRTNRSPFYVTHNS